MSEAKISRQSGALLTNAEQSDVPELRRLAEAQAALEHARRHAKWRRKCKRLESAALAVREAAMAAHRAGVAWTEIGDVLGMQRASAPVPHGTSKAPIPAPPVDRAAALERAEPRNSTLLLVPPP